MNHFKLSNFTYRRINFVISNIIILKPCVYVLIIYSNEPFQKKNNFVHNRPINFVILDLIIFETLCVYLLLSYFQMNHFKQSNFI